jgi:hypothetical protein
VAHLLQVREAERGRALPLACGTDWIEPRQISPKKALA